MRRLVRYLAAMMILAGCADKKDSYAPRPYAYARMELPDASYVTTSGLPVNFERNASTLLTERDEQGGARHIDIVYPGLGTTLYLTLTPVDSPLMAAEVLDNRAERMARNTGDNNTEIITLVDPEATVTVTPAGSPTPVQMLSLTPSGRYVLSAQAFVPAAPDAPGDSLRPLVDMLRRDIIHLAQTINDAADNNTSH